MSGYIGNAPVPQATQTRDDFTATSGQTTFATSGYTPGYLDVYLNGVKLATSDYTATNGSDVVLTVGAATGDILSVIAWTAFEATNVDYANVTNTPTLATVATTGAYSDLTGSPTAVSSFTNDAGYATTTYVDTAESDAVTTANAYTDSALAGISSDAITEGNSSVEVVDTGTGYVAVTIDGSETARFSPNTTTINGDLDVQNHAIDMGDNSTSVPIFTYNTNPTTASATIGQTAYEWNGNKVVAVEGKSGNDTTNKDNGIFQVRVAESGNLNTGGLFVLDHNGNAGIGTSSPATTLDISATVPTLRFTDKSTNGYTQFIGRDDGGIQIEADQGNTQANSVIIFKVDTAERGRFDSSGNFKFNSGYGSVATAYGCRAWIQFNMSTGAVGNSGGVSSITDNGTGNFTINLSTATPDVNFSVQVSDNYGQAFTETYTTTSFRVKAYNANYALRDSTLYMAAMFR